MFTGESPENYEQKCHCILVLDVSGSMQGESIAQLNRGLQEFQTEVISDYQASQRLEISIVTFGSTVQCIQEPTLITNFQMPMLEAGGLTKMVDAVRLAISLDQQRKQWYRNTGQNYYRSIIVLITDGQPEPADQDIEGLSREVRDGVKNKNFIFYGLGVKGYNHQKLAQICSVELPPLPLDGYKYAEFFQWLSNSIGMITKSKEGEVLQLPAVTGWTQIQM